MMRAAFCALLVLLAVPSALAVEGPCRRLIDACHEAGLSEKVARSKGKGLHVDCMKRLLSGERIDGISIPEADIAACKAKKTKKRDRPDPART